MTRAPRLLRLAVTALIVPTVVVAVALSPWSSVTSVTGTVSGRVYQDFASNGTYDTTVSGGVAYDRGLEGVTVTAYDSTGAVVGTATTAANGTYTLTATNAATADVRVEFSLPTTGTLSRFESSFLGSDNASTIQFVTVPATDVDLGLNLPGEYCQNNPHIGVSRLCNLNRGATTDSPTIFITRYNGGPYTAANGFSTVYTDWTANTAGTMSQTEAILGMAWDKRSRRIISSAYVRRLVPLYESPVGTPLPGALFTTTPNATSGSTTGGTTSFLVDLEPLLPGDQFSNSNPAGPGFIPSNAARGLADIMTAVDSDLVGGKTGVYEEVGKVGIGDIDADDDGNLWVVSLYDRNLYKVTLPADGSAPTTMVAAGDIAANSPPCTNGDVRPFGVEIYRGVVYLGVVCDGSRDFNPADPTNALDDVNLTFSVLAYDPDANTWATEVGPISLFANGVAIKGQNAAGASPSEDVRWNPWVDTFSADLLESTGWGDVRPVPMLSDIEFDDDGSIIVGFRDRSGDQSSPGVGLLNPIDVETTKQLVASGDVYRICRVSGVYVFEGGVGCARTFGNNTATTTDDEWYGADDYFTAHSEIGSGMLEKVPGFTESLMTAYDPSDVAGSAQIFNSGGVTWMSNLSGGKQRVGINSGGGTIFYSNPNVATPNSEGAFGKTNGMSDVEALCNLAPVQVGNRLWLDLDRDGIQDPGEPPLAGVTVNLYNSAGVKVGTAVTDANGVYSFSSTIGAIGDPDADGDLTDSSGGGLLPNETFTIRIDNPADYAAGGPLAGLGLSPADQTSPTSDLDDSIDSDATLVGGFARIDVPALAPGENVHTLDAGFFVLPATPDPIVAVGDYTWIDTNADGVQDPGEPPLAGMRVELLNPDGTPAVDRDGVVVAPITTGADGSYLFDNLRPGDYRMRFTLPDGSPYSFTRTGSGTSANDSNPDPATGLTPVFSLRGSESGDMVGVSDPAIRAQFINRTIDAGVITRPAGVVSVGDRVWIDRNGDGRQDPGEPGLAGATLRLLDANGNPARYPDGTLVPPIRTNATGRYLFEGLPPGTYTVTIEYPKGYQPTVSGRGTRDRDSSRNRATSLTLQAGERDLTLDFGVVLALLALTG